MFGREDEGLTEEVRQTHAMDGHDDASAAGPPICCQTPAPASQEVRLCGAVCTLPVGRLQESLSLSHAVVIALSQLFQVRVVMERGERKGLAAASWC